MRKISAKHIKQAKILDLSSDNLLDLQGLIEDDEDHGLSFCKFIINDLQKQHPNFFLELTCDRQFYTLYLGKITDPREFDDKPKGSLIVYLAVLSLDQSWGIDYMPLLPNFIFDYKGIKYKLGEKHPWYYSVEPI